MFHSTFRCIPETFNIIRTLKGVAGAFKNFVIAGVNESMVSLMP